MLAEMFFTHTQTYTIYTRNASWLNYSYIFGYQLPVGSKIKEEGTCH